MKPIYVTSPSLPPLEEFIPYLEKIWESKWLTNNGQFHQQFEVALAKYLGIKYVSFFTNGMIALQTGIQALRITGEVITTPFTFVATTHAIHKKSISTPILLIIFNRPETTQAVFNAIREAKPAILYISADAPRDGNANDVINCAKARAIVKDVDWECETHYRFLDQNVGCGYGPASAISWVFEREDRAIILEDDCVPAQSFFPYCDYLLEKFKNDQRIWLVSGRSHHPHYQFFDTHDYIFTFFGHTWGWATWKRCWNHFDIEMSDYPLFAKEGGFFNVFSNPDIAKYFNSTYNAYYNDKQLSSHVWDYQWVYARLKNRGLCIVPSKNMILNIGAVGTHSNCVSSVHLIEKDEDYLLKSEPHFMLPIRDYEEMHFRRHISPSVHLAKKIFLIGRRLRIRVSRIIHSFFNRAQALSHN